MNGAQWLAAALLFALGYWCGRRARRRQRLAATMQGSADRLARRGRRCRG